MHKKEMKRQFKLPQKSWAKHKQCLKAVAERDSGPGGFEDYSVFLGELRFLKLDGFLQLTASGRALYECLYVTQDLTSEKKLLLKALTVYLPARAVQESFWKTTPSIEQVRNLMKSGGYWSGERSFKYFLALLEYAEMVRYDKNGGMLIVLVPRGTSRGE